MTYKFHCKACNQIFETDLPISACDRADCPRCGKSTFTKIPCQPHFILVGSEWPGKKAKESK